MIRSQLHISREMPFTKVVRGAEEDAKGVKPVTVTFEKSTVSIGPRGSLGQCLENYFNKSKGC